MNTIHKTFAIATMSTILLGGSAIPRSDAANSPAYRDGSAT